MTKAQYKTIMKGLTDTSQAPRGKNIFYHCEICQEYISSQPDDNIGCKCSNIVIDVDYIRLSVRDFTKFTMVQKV